MVFSKPDNQLRKGKKILAKLSTVKCIAVVHWPRGLGRRNSGRATQVFIRFNGEPWSMLVDSGGSISSAEGAADTLSGFLSIPKIYDPVLPMNLPSTKRRGFPVVMPDDKKESIN